MFVYPKLLASHAFGKYLTVSHNSGLYLYEFLHKVSCMMVDVLVAPPEPHGTTDLLSVKLF